MRFKNTRDVLEHIRQFHQEVSDRYRRVSDETDKKRLKLLLDYISEREQKLADAISVFTEGTSDKVLDTWFQYTSDDTPIRRLLDSDMSPDMTPDDLMRVTLQVADHFIALHGDIVTAADTDEIRVILQDGTSYAARVIGTDPETDLAVLRVEASRLQPIILAAADSLRVGDVVLAIGNPLNTGQTVTMGIVSATGRSQSIRA